MVREKNLELSLALLDQTIALSEPPAIGLGEFWAARGEALALRDKPQESADCYRKAIAASTNDLASRLWSYNLAEILRPLGQDQDRARLLEVVVEGKADEELTKRAIESQSVSGAAMPSNSGAAPFDSAVERAEGRTTGESPPPRGTP